jgi:hypothetical protein
MAAVRAFATVVKRLSNRAMGHHPAGTCSYDCCTLMGELPSIRAQVQMKMFRNWVARERGSPADRAARAKVREILR